jgi:NAD(P)-dependent dehydrogenase (short-subunit alcohol dehydrogenase family)
MALPAGINDFSLAGKRALVIGAEHPLGRVAAVALSDSGARVSLASQETDGAEALNETAKAVEASGHEKVTTCVQRAAVRSDLEATIDLTLRELSGLEILVTALDSPFYAPIEATDDLAFARVMENNFKNVWLASQQTGSVMLERGGGTIVHLCNVMAERGVPNATLYCAAKGAVRNLIRALSLEWARRGVRVNMIECGWLETDVVANRGDEFSERLIKYLPYRRLVKPEDVAGALIYLVSPAAGFVTGESIAIDGGLLCRV